MNDKLRHGCAALVLSCFSALPITASSSFPAAAHAPETKDFRDDFAGTSLRPEWTIVNQDANRWALVDNDYMLLVLKDEKNKFCYNRTVPDQYEFFIKVTITEGLKSDVIGGKRIMSGSEVFYISIDNAKNEGTKLEISGEVTQKKEIFAFLKTVGAARPELWEEGAEYPKGEREYYLRIAKSGIAYIGYISPDGTSWTEVGKHYFPGLSGSPCFGGSQPPVQKKPSRSILPS